MSYESQTDTLKKYFSFICLPIKEEIAIGNGNLHYQNIKPELLILRVWHMAVCLALQSKSGIFLEPYG